MVLSCSLLHGADSSFNNHHCYLSFHYYQDLARLSLHRPEYLSVHAQHSDATPTQLVQNYVVCRLHEKLDVLYSFIKSHLKNKIVVFLSSCAQVRFVFECFRGMQPGIPLMALHGKIKQDKRTLIYLDYARKPAACLFATDIAARGLDFPDVDWVVQVDAPEDRAMYIHRVGRTARYTSSGRALLLLMPQEEKVVMDELTGGSTHKEKSSGKDKEKVVGTVNNIPLKKLSMNPKRSVQVSNRAAAMIVANPEYRSLAKKSFLSYLKSLSLLSHRKHVYRWSPSELDAYATSLGLHQTPELPVQKAAIDEGAGEEEGGDETKKKKNVNRSLDKLKAQIKAAKEEKKRLREEKLGKKITKKSETDEEDEDEDEDVLLVVKKEEGRADLEQPVADVSSTIPSAESAAANIKATKRKKERALKISKDGETRNSTRKVFDNDGELIDPLASLTRALGAANDSESDDNVEGLSASIASRVSAAKSKLDSVRKEDDLREKERVKEKRLKLKRKKANQNDDEDENNAAVCTLSNVVESDDDSDDSSGSSSGSDRDSGSDSEEDSGLVKGRVVRGAKKSARYSSGDDDSDSDDDRMDEDNSSDSDSDSDDSDSEPMPKKSKKLSAAELRAHEAMVLKLMK